MNERNDFLMEEVSLKTHNFYLTLSILSIPLLWILNLFLPLKYVILFDLPKDKKTLYKYFLMDFVDNICDKIPDPQKIYLCQFNCISFSSILIFFFSPSIWDILFFPILIFIILFGLFLLCYKTYIHR